MNARMAIGENRLSWESDRGLHGSPGIKEGRVIRERTQLELFWPVRCIEEPHVGKLTAEAVRHRVEREFRSTAGWWGSATSRA